MLAAGGHHPGAGERARAGSRHDRGRRSRSRSDRAGESLGTGGQRPGHRPAGSGRPVNRIDRAFQDLRPTGRLALIAYLTAGYPSLKDTPALVEAVAGAGADMIELGFPFSDPLADGPTIQAASQAALKQGVTVARALEAAAAARRRTTKPLLVMTYLNPVLAFGVEAFCRQATQASIDGLIIPDLPPEEAGELRGAAAQAGLDLVFFVAPTSTPARIRAAAKAATGFIYCVALTGVTGARDQLDPAVLPLVRSVKAEAATEAAILEATQDLLTQIRTVNAVRPEDVAGIWFTTSRDLSAEFPARAARRLGWTEVPMLCGHEMEVPAANSRSVPRCIR